MNYVHQCFFSRYIHAISGASENDLTQKKKKEIKKLLHMMLIAINVMFSLPYPRGTGFSLLIMVVFVTIFLQAHESCKWFFVSYLFRLVYFIRSLLFHLLF